MLGKRHRMTGLPAGAVRLQPVGYVPTLDNGTADLQAGPRMVLLTLTAADGREVCSGLDVGEAGVLATLLVEAAAEASADRWAS